MPRTEVTGSQIKDASVSLTADVIGVLPAANGGLGVASPNANHVLLGNGTGAVQTVAPGTSLNLLASNGSTWVSTTVLSGTSKITVGTIAPSSPTTGDLWVDTN